jgi:hypothetical protein
MRRTTTLGGLVLIGLSLTGACVTGGGDPDEPAGGNETQAVGIRHGSTIRSVRPDAQPDVIDVASDSRASLWLQGALGPVLDGWTIAKATVTLRDVQLVRDDGTLAVLASDGVTTDLLAVDDEPKKLVDPVSLAAGQYTGVRLHLTSAWVQAADAQGATHVFASDDVDASQLPAGASVGKLQMSGMDHGGFVTVALPPGGVHVQETAALGLHFALARSLSVQSSDVWVLDPRVWVAEAGTFSSVDLQLQATSDSFSKLMSRGFRVMLLDAGMQPVCGVALETASPTMFHAIFHHVESFEGPFVAVLLPPSDTSLTSQLAVSIDVEPGVRVETDIGLSSVREVSSGTLEVRAGNEAISIQRDSAGKVVRQEERPVGWMAEVAPRSPAPPHLPGLPTSRNEQQSDGGAPPVPEAGVRVPEVDGSVVVARDH